VTNVGASIPARLEVMQIKVDERALSASGAALQAIGARVDSYAACIDRRSRQVGDGLDDDLGDALATASAELARSVEALSAGYRDYGRALRQLATGYAELERSVTVPRR
jgi:hypothetical protein